MIQSARFRFIARAWFVLALFAAILMSFLSLESHAQTPPQTQTSGGRGAAPGPNAANTGHSPAQLNPEDYIENYSAEIFRQIREGRLTPPSGREMESRQIERGLYGEGSTGASTVAIIGDPNIGKTHAMIQYIVDNPEDVVYRIKTENLGQLAAEQNNSLLAKSAASTALKKILIHLEQKGRASTGGRLITYIDNLNSLMEGAQVEMKPAGAITEAVAEKRELRLVLETSAPTFKSIGELSPSFKALVTSIEVGPPKFDTILDYLRLHRSTIEKTSGVALSEPALAEAARLGLRFFATDPFRKAFELLSHAASTLRRDQNLGATELVRLQAIAGKLKLEIASIQHDLDFHPDAAQSARLAELKGKLDSLERKSEGLKTADVNSSVEIDDLQQEITQLTESLKEKPSSWWSGFTGESERTRLNADIARKTTRMEMLRTLQTEAVNPEGKPATRVAPKHVQNAAAEYTGLEAATIAMDVREGAARIEEIGKELFNMDHLIKRAKQRIATYLTETEMLEEDAIANPSLKKPIRQKPIWSAVIPGRTGTGKSDFAMRLAEKLGMPLLKIHMSTYNQSHGSSGLIGARPEYIGFGEEGELTGPVRKTPYILIMLDEIQRAHLNVLKTIIYPILDQGEIKDSQGRTVYFDKAIILGPTNAGEQFAAMPREEIVKFLLANSKELTEPKMLAMDLNELRAEAVRVDLRVTYHWEESMVGRFDDIIVTNNLSPEVIEKIAHKNMAKFSKDIGSRKIRVKLSETAMKALIDSFDPTQGARSLEAYFKRFIKDPVYEQWGVNEIKRGQVVVIDFKDNSFDYIKSTPEMFAEAERGGSVSAERTSLKIQNQLATRGQKLTPETRPGFFHLFSEEFMVRNATAKILRRLKE